MSSLAYRYTAELTFVGADGEQNIDPLFIRHLVIENLYIDRTMPIIYISLALTPELYEDVIESESIATFFFSLNCYNAYSNNPVASGSFKGIFNYVVSTNNPSYDTPLSRQSQSPDGNYRSLTIALMGVNQLNASRAEKDVNDGILVSGVFGEVDTNTLIGKVINGFEKYNLTSILKAPEYNNQFEELIIPPMNNRQDIMQFVFDKAPFYDTPFTFYLDFHNAYLLAASQTDEGYFVEDGSGINNVIFDSKNITKSDSYEEGMDIEGDSIIVHVNPSHMSIFPNKVQDKVANNLVTIDEAGNIDAKELDINSNENSDPKYTFKRGGKAQLYQNILESNLVQIIISKEGLNSSMFTPNKKYFIKNHVGTSDYNGAYMLIEKKDIIRSNNGVMRCTTEFTLRKIGNIGKIGETIVNSRNVRNSSRSKNSTPASTSKPTTNPASGNGNSSQTSTTPGGTTKVASTERTVRKIIPKVEERSTGGVQYITDYDSSYSVTQPAVMGSSYMKASVESEEVQELSEEEWLARTSIRGSAAIIDISNAGPTRIINDKGKGTLNKSIFG